MSTNATMRSDFGQFISKCLVGAVLLVLVLAGCGQTEKTLPVCRIVGETMGTTFQVQVVGEEPHLPDADELKQSLEVRLKEINRSMSTYDPDSEISRFNREAAAVPIELSSDFLRVYLAAQDVFQKTGGCFDPTVGPLVELWGFGARPTELEPPDDDQVKSLMKGIGMDRMVEAAGMLLKTSSGVELDFNAIAKGYAVDQLAEALIQRGFGNYLVEVGGEIRVGGTNASQEPWRLGIETPDTPVNRRRAQTVIQLTDRSLATSGDYRNFFVWNGERYTHVIDPRTGYPVPAELASVSILASDCMTADAVATAVMVMGEEQALVWLEQQPDLEGLLVVREPQDHSYRVVQTAGWPAPPLQSN